MQASQMHQMDHQQYQQYQEHQAPMMDHQQLQFMQGIDQQQNDTIRLLRLLQEGKLDHLTPQEIETLQQYAEADGLENQLM